MLKCLLPSVSVALLITWVSLVFRLVEVALFLPRLSTRPVPTETTHSSGVLGHKHLDSWIASAVGLLIRRPPSCPRNKREKVFYGKTWGKKKKKNYELLLEASKAFLVFNHQWVKPFKIIWWNKKKRFTCSCRGAHQIPPQWLWYPTSTREDLSLTSAGYPGWWGRNCGLRVTLNRHEAERPRGWQQDQTHRDQSSLKRPGWGGCGSCGAPNCRFHVAASTCVFDQKLVSA